MLLVHCCFRRRPSPSEISLGGLLCLGSFLEVLFIIEDGLTTTTPGYLLFIPRSCQSRARENVKFIIPHTTYPNRNTSAGRGVWDVL